MLVYKLTVYQYKAPFTHTVSLNIEGSNLGGRYVRTQTLPFFLHRHYLANPLVSSLGSCMTRGARREVS